MKIAKRNRVLKGSPTRIYAKQLKASKTMNFLELEALEKYLEEYSLLPMFKLQ
ncbi:conserved hypothetical protein [Ricinus communis]|uniref:Uncharacterized protein n=1 Tax=Ricinus communis TaxID=3988 RepID=B9S3F2_RICCO|nr:conserved hypothetical protein [Ricinus communis]